MTPDVPQDGKSMTGSSHLTEKMHNAIRASSIGTVTALVRCVAKPSGCRVAISTNFSAQEAYHALVQVTMLSLHVSGFGSKCLSLLVTLSKLP